jgi:hypothetical protein
MLRFHPAFEVLSKDDGVLIQMNISIKRIRAQAGCAPLINLVGNLSCRSNIHLNCRAYADLNPQWGNRYEVKMEREGNPISGKVPGFRTSEGNGISQSLPHDDRSKTLRK